MLTTPPIDVYSLYAVSFTQGTDKTEPNGSWWLERRQFLMDVGPACGTSKTTRKLTVTFQSHVGTGLCLGLLGSAVIVVVQGDPQISTLFCTP